MDTYPMSTKDYKGLIIKKQWLDKILNGEKIWELRGFNTKYRGYIGLIESSSGKIKGIAKIKNSIKLDNNTFKNSYKKHKVPVQEYLDNPFYKTTYAWEIEVISLVDISYIHKNGATIFVKLDDNHEYVSKINSI